MANSGGFSHLWAEAIEDYERQTDRKIEYDKVFREFGTLEEVEDAIMEQKERFSNFRDEHQRVYSALKSSITPMQQMLELVQKGVGNTPYAPASVVFGASSYLLQACTSVSKSYDAIQELFEQMRDITVRLNQYDFKSIDSSLSEKLKDILAFFLDVMGKAEAAIKRRRFKQWARSVFTKDDGISSSLDRLRNYVESEMGLVIALTYGRVQEVQETVSETQKIVKSGLEEVLANQRSDRQKAFSEAEEKKLADALKSPTFEEVAREHAGNWEKLTKGTAAWIRDDDMFQAWEQEKAPFLWIFGKPGVGKTMLAARTIETLQNKYPQHSDIPSLTSISYIYFKDDNPILQDCAQMWKAAAFQITKANDRFKKHVLAILEKKQDTFASARLIWQQLFLDFFIDNDNSRSLTSLAFIIVDGLDEAPQAERVKFLACLSELVNRGPGQHKCRIQVAVFARPDVRADPGFEKVSFRMQERLIEVTPERNNADIDLYIRQRLSDVLVLQELKKRKVVKERQTLARQIQTAVQSKSQGMFLWARLVFDQIRASPSPEAIRASLQKAPEGLDDMLYHVFKRLGVDEEMHQSYLKDLLTWVYCAYRPLFISELFVLLMITANQHSYLLERDLRARYSSLFDVTGPYAEPDDDHDQLTGNDTENSVDEDDFEFLDDDVTSLDESTDNGTNRSESENDEKNPVAKDTIPSSQSDEEEGAFEIPYHWYENTVAFSHARIRDYLRVEGDPGTRRWHDYSVVPDDLNNARLSIFIACVQILYTNIADTHGVDSLKYYAKINWIKHLVDVDLSKLSKSAAVLLARKLATSFYSGHGLLQTSYGAEYAFTETWFSAGKYRTIVRSIIGDYIEYLDESQREWASLAAKSARALFQPLVEACAKKWLIKKGWDDPAYLDKSESEVKLLYACSTLVDDDEAGVPEESIEVMHGYRSVELDTLQALAKMVPVPESAHYYTGLAWIMMEAEEAAYTDRAIEYFKKALELLPGGWVAKEGLARCYGENLKEYETAIGWMEGAISGLSQTGDLEGIDFYLRTRISDWKLQLGDNEDSVEVARASYEGGRCFIWGNGSASDSSILRSIKHYIEALYRTGNYREIVDLLHDLDGRETFEREKSLLTVFVRQQVDEYYAVDFFNKIGKITQTLRDSSLHDFLKVCLVKAVNLTSENIVDYNPIWLADEVGEWQYHYAPDPEESVAMWEKIVKLVDQGNEVVQQNQNWFRTRAADFLTRIFFNSAKDKRHVGEETTQIIAKIEDLAQHQQGSKRYYRASYPAQILGMWLHEYEHKEQEEWRACIRPSVKQALYLLSDEDPFNDQQAYGQLGQALFAAGDILNGSIAYGVTVRPLEDHRQELAKKVGGQHSQGNVNADASNFREVKANEEKGNDLKESINELEEATPAEDAMHPNDERTRQDMSSHNEETGISGKENDDSTERTTAVEELANEGESAGSKSAGGNDEDDETSSENMNPKYAGFSYWWACDGPCGTLESDYAELWICRVCGDGCYCEKCIDLHRRDEIPTRNCASDHPLVHIFPMTSEAKELTDALVERRFDVQQRWLDDLKKMWED